MKADNIRVLVIGASGFIGKSFCNLLGQEKIDFVTHNEFKIDIRFKNSFEVAKNKGITHVIHLAGKTFVPDSWKSPADFIEVNVLGTQNVIDYCFENKCRLIYISAYIYGNPIQLPINENHPLNPNNPYALSKMQAEELISFYAKNKNLSSAIIRPFNVYGPWQNANFLIPHIFSQVRNNNEIHVKDLSPKRDYIYVDDLSRMIFILMLRNNFDIYNGGTGISYSVLDIINSIQKIEKTKKKIVSSQEVRSNEITDTVADISKAMRELAWQPQITISRGLQLISESLRV